MCWSQQVKKIDPKEIFIQDIRCIFCKPLPRRLEQMPVLEKQPCIEPGQKAIIIKEGKKAHGIVNEEDQYS